MNSLYGDNIFAKSLDSILLSFSESSKIFLEYDEITITEDTKDFKTRIKEAIKKIIQRIKDFLDWVKTKVKDVWTKLTAKIKSKDLKKSLKDAEDRAKNKSTNESVILSEATYSEIQNYINQKIIYHGFICDGSDIVSWIDVDSEIYTESDDDGGVVADEEYILSTKSLCVKRNPGSISKVIAKPTEITIKNFILSKDNINERYDKILMKLSEYEKEVKADLSEYQQIQNKINSANITNANDLLNIIKLDQESGNITEKINNTNKKITNISRVYGYIMDAKNNLDKITDKIDAHLKKM